MGLDTNVLVRFIVEDDADQAALASRFILDNLTADNPGYVNLVVLVETVWVLERAYRYSRSQIAGLLEAILTTAELRVEAAELVWPLVRGYRAGAPNFADLLIAAVNREAECSETVTFDRRFASLEGVRAI